MKLNHEDSIVAIWNDTDETWKDKATRLRGAWSLVLWSYPDTDREMEEKYAAMVDLELLVSIAWEHRFTELAVAA